MSKVTSYMFVPGNREQGLEKPFRKEITDTTNIILDLEDAVNDPTNAEHAAELKNQARKLVSEFLTHNETTGFFMRVNKFGSDQWQIDQELLAQFPNEAKAKLEGIILPKVTGPEEIEAAKQWLESNEFKSSIIPLIETKEGMERLAEIAKLEGIDSLMFGHHDYFYDMGDYPIPQSALTSEKYREKLRYMIQTLNGNGKELIDGIYPNLKDAEGMQKNCELLLQMAEGTDLRMAKLALNPMQAKAIHETEPRETEIAIDNRDGELSETELKELAEKIVTNYGERETKNLGVTRMESTYLSPQQYLSSERYLKDREGRETELPRPDLR